MEQSKILVINGYRSRKQIATIVKISRRTLYRLLNSDNLKDKIPKRGRLTPKHQQFIFDELGIPYIFKYE